MSKTKDILVPRETLEACENVIDSLVSGSATLFDPLQVLRDVETILAGEDAKPVDETRDMRGRFNEPELARDWPGVRVRTEKELSGSLGILVPKGTDMEVLKANLKRGTFILRTVAPFKGGTVYVENAYRGQFVLI